MTVDLEALRALERAATPGPWTAEHDVYRDVWAIGGGDEIVCSLWRLDEETHREMPHDEAHVLANAAFIAAARNALPALADEVERLRAENVRVQAAHIREIVALYDRLAAINDEIEVGEDGYARFASVNDRDGLREIVRELEPRGLFQRGDQ